MTKALQWPPSLWAAVTAEETTYAPLRGTATVDAVVIGAGFTGLSTALHLARRGFKTTVLEAKAPGWGASGRNNGQVIPTLSRPDPDDIVRRHGATGERLVALIRDSASILFDIVRDEGISCEAEQTGWVQPVHTPGRMKIAERRVAQWSKHGAPVALLTAAEMKAKLGSRAWHGGWSNPTGGHVNPLALARGLAHACARRGVTIHSESPATSYERTAQGWRVLTPEGEVKARTLMLATNAYTGEIARGLAPSIAKEVVPVLSWQMATAPISDNVRATVLPGRPAMSDTHGELFFMRYWRDRLVTGGALAVAANGAERLKPYIAERMRAAFPQLGELTFDYVWNGYIGMTRDYLPRVHRLGPDGYAWAGCNGRAVALSIALGREFAAAMAGEPVNELALPFTEPDPIPMHGLVRQVAPLMLVEYKRRDRREV